MRIRIFTKQYDELRTEIRNRARKKEWNTWEVVKCGTQKVERLVHAPEGDDQYKDIQLRLVNPNKDDVKKGINYLDIEPVAKSTSKLTDKQKRDKKAIVLGRFCEVLKGCSIN